MTPIKSENSSYLGQWIIGTNTRQGKGICIKKKQADISDKGIKEKSILKILGEKYEGWWINDKANGKGRFI